MLLQKDHCSCIGETERSLKSRVQEHKRPSLTNSEVSRYINDEEPSQTVNLDDAKILDTDNR